MPGASQFGVWGCIQQLLAWQRCWSQAGDGCMGKARGFGGAGFGKAAPSSSMPPPGPAPGDLVAPLGAEQPRARGGVD